LIIINKKSIKLKRNFKCFFLDFDIFRNLMNTRRKHPAKKRIKQGIFTSPNFHRIPKKSRIFEKYRLKSIVLAHSQIFNWSKFTFYLSQFGSKKLQNMDKQTLEIQGLSLKDS
jgi:hypothetical protein